MEGYIFDIKRFAIHDGPGIRQTVFMKGCPLSCWWCHNPESRRPGIQIIQKESCKNDGIDEILQVGRKIHSTMLLEAILKDQVFYEHSGGGVSFSGGEPFMQFDFLMEMVQLCRHNNIHTAIDTSGYVSLDKLKRVAEFADLFLYDLKHLEDSEHKKHTGVSNRLILSNLEFLNSMQKELFIRFPFVPGVNDEESHLLALAEYVGSLNNVKQINILPYHKMGKTKYVKFNIPEKARIADSPGNNKLVEAATIFESFGKKVVIGG